MVLKIDDREGERVGVEDILKEKERRSTVSEIE